MCRSKKFNPGSNRCDYQHARTVKHLEEETQTVEEEEYCLSQLTTQQHNTPTVVKTVIKGHPLCMEVDLGTAFSLVSGDESGEASLSWNKQSASTHTLVSR